MHLPRSVHQVFQRWDSTRNHVLCLFSSGCRQTCWHDTTCIADPVTCYSRTTRFFFLLLLCSSTNVLSNGPCIVSSFVGSVNQGCASAVRSLVHPLVLVMSMLDCLMFSQPLFTVTMKRSDQNFTFWMKNPHIERHLA